MSEEMIIKTEYSDIMQKSYIDYAMSVIVARALPDVRDGLKPVQRRSLYDESKIICKAHLRKMQNHQKKRQYQSNLRESEA